MGKNKTILFGGISIAIVLVLVVLSNFNINKTIDDPVTGVEPTSPVAESTEKEDSKDVVTVEVEQKQDGPKEYVDFVYDVNETDADYLKSLDKVSIQGSGKPMEHQSDKVSIEGTSGTSESGFTGNATTTQRAWDDIASDPTGMWSINTDWGTAFSVRPSVKYDITVQMVGHNIGIMNAPNETEVYVSEYNAESGDAYYWRHEYLVDINMGYYDMVMDDFAIDYGTPYILGTGLTDWSMYSIKSPEDCTVEGNIQLLCDTERQSQFGEGYYIENFDTNTGMYYGCYIVQHGTRVYKFHGRSECQPTLRDIVTATADRCVYVF